ncbi:TetR family transcriptional regulator [Stenotrophomonas sp. Betaine-02u-21]|uniref:TetR/AcrR family transcriptional regulator n=1 Tax=unclassified Stenotrophomonas TaxID=196198 RepID=UPI000C31C66E|nr:MULTISPECIES: TetR/AcrR family transcriptional regulator [unclassified Stenotrophomonas]PKH74700.1 TetR family transcriptional regulator [Stenotrophomonas sp. Betaine-02u-23]PKH75629.1 TetR family transcriptional regulator [Stenotrophomonas sp. Betaine-02u-21]PKH94534.1 TetR family transcriptional regulator [Stenotrophomonas sp. Bg11-02]
MNAVPATANVREKILATGQRIMGGKGFSAVGLNEVLAAAGVPKGSFYHYFGSKDAFGEALLEGYFEAYVADMERIFRQPGKTKAAQIEDYFAAWQDNQSFEDCQGKCLAVKLGAEVADLSDSMRSALDRGTAAIIAGMAAAIEAGQAEGSLPVQDDAKALAQSLYQLWLGASIMVKIVRTPQPFDNALRTTRHLLGPPANTAVS